MVPIKSVVHFSIPVSDVERSTRFYTEIVGCRHLATVAQGVILIVVVMFGSLTQLRRDRA